LEINEILQRNSPIPLASISKPFTAFAVLKLVEGGYLKLNESISKYLPEVTAFKSLKGSKEITIQDLLQHTSGIPSEGKTTMVQILIGNRKFNIPNQTHVAGSKFIYSNHNYRLLARIIEASIGEPIAEYVKEILLDPLEITDYNHSYYEGASGLAISPDGVAKFSQMILSGGRFGGYELISKKMMKTFFRIPKISETQERYYGIGWQIELENDKKKIRSLGHRGSGDLTASILRIYPHKKTILMYFGVQSGKSKPKFLNLNKLTEKNLEKYLELLEKLDKTPLKKFPPMR
jgi:CubicO group peptidase (beta-lactamase class C family)